MAPNNKKSKIWSYFKKFDKNKAICKFCNKCLKTSGNTTNVRCHLEKKHPDVIEGSRAEEAIRAKTEFSDETKDDSHHDETIVDEKDVHDLMGNLNKDTIYLNKKMKSKFWSYFKRLDNDQAICKFCNKCLKTSGNTSNIRCHLEKIHPDVIQESVAGEPVRKKMKGNDETNFPGCSSKTEKTDLQTEEELSPKCKKITEAIVNFIIIDHKPFSIVEGHGFKQLMKELVPFYQIPSRETLKKHIDEKYEAMSEV